MSDESEITVSARIVINEELHDWLLDSFDALRELSQSAGRTYDAERYLLAWKSVKAKRYMIESAEIMVLLMLRAGFCHIDRRGTFGAWENAVL